MTAFRRVSHAPLTPWAVLGLAMVMLVVPVCAPLCASAIGVCAMPEAVAPPIDAHCPMAEAMGHGGIEHGETAAMDCCVSDAVPQGPVPGVPSPAKKADGERQLSGASLLALAPAAALPALAALPSAPAPSPPAADLAAPAVPLYTLLSTLLS